MVEPLPLAGGRTLGPEDLRTAAAAFEAALQLLDESTAHINPLSARRMLASFVMEGVLNGERDREKLCDEALTRLKNMPTCAGAYASVTRRPPRSARTSGR